jgi:hypothetical protein
MGAPEEEGPIPFSAPKIHNIGNFNLSVDDTGGEDGWTTLDFPNFSPDQTDHLFKAWLAIGNASSKVLCGGAGINDFTATDFIMYTPGGSFDQNTTANFTGAIDSINLRVHQRTFQNANQSGKVGHDGGWLIVEYNVLNTHISKTANDLYLMEYTNWNVNNTSNDDKYFHFADKKMSVIYDVTQDYTYYMATAQIFGDMQGYNAGLKSILLEGGDDATIFSNMSLPGNHTSSSIQQDWYTNLVANLSDLGPGETTTLAFVFIAGNSTDELNASYDDAIKAYFRPSISLPDVEGGLWKAGNVKVSAVPLDTAPGTIASVEFE